ncbi:related to nuclear protein ES2 [Ramularia collo-cygni]|uniref:Related to nuclear protein ES2 n=1 Tax=Ramularia collo-cygni TaxID=112498 RepID=A0A2D3V0G4_9PEZI|nr:related to nuclear protein ES2 [Ramularia collo-cygni]CZT23807.1 related to nuclear protein ES2 [Ramularia collo-cygni]
MSSSPSKVLAKRNSETALMPPPPPSFKRQKRPGKVLDEDVYSDAISHIVARDFFPGLLETEAQKEYLEALDSNNRDWIRDAGRKLTQVMTPVPDGQRRSGRGTSFTPRRSAALGDTPRSYVGETPGQTPSVNSDFAPEERKPEVDLNLSLGAFQAKYTSEDNESFNALLDKQNEKRAAKYGFFHNGNKIPSARQLAYREREQKLLQEKETSSSAMVATDSKTVKGDSALITTNAVGEERVALAPNRPSADLDARLASVDSFPSRQGPRNHFMFGPEGIEDQLVTRAQLAEQSSNAPPKAVTYGATRFRTAVEPDHAIPASPSMSAVDAAIAGRPLPTESESGYGGAETPRVNGYAFVDAEPTPRELGVPVSDDEADAAEREAATRLLPKVDESPNPFHIANRSKREDVLMRLVEKADAQRRTGGRMEQLRTMGITPGRTPTPRFTSGPKLRQGTAMTPAAQSLANRIGTPRRGDGSLFASGRKDKAGWTPTPRIKRPD